MRQWSGKAWLQLALSFLAGFIVVLAFALLLFDNPVGRFLDRWQPLAVGALAILAAFIAAIPVRAQNAALRIRQENSDAVATVTILNVAKDIMANAFELQGGLRRDKTMPSHGFFGEEWQDEFLPSLMRAAPAFILGPLVALIGRCRDFNREHGEWWGRAAPEGLDLKMIEELGKIAEDAFKLVTTAKEFGDAKISEEHARNSP